MSSTRSSTATASPSAKAVPTPTLNTAGLSAEEAADRRAIQDVWVRYWNTEFTEAVRSAGQRLALFKPVAVDPNLSELVKSAATFSAKGWADYGVPGHRIYWGPPVDGADQAIMGDCMDFSHSGRLDIKTKRALTVGIPRSNVRGIFERQADDTWRVSDLQFLEDTSC